MALKALDQRLAGGAASPATRQPNSSTSSTPQPPQASNADATQQPAAADSGTKNNEEQR